MLSNHDSSVVQSVAELHRLRYPDILIFTTGHNIREEAEDLSQLHPRDANALACRMW
jgi:hypothetical protein